jgi:hypothetical protein
MPCNENPRPFTRREALSQLGGGFGLIAFANTTTAKGTHGTLTRTSSPTGKLAKDSVPASIWPLLETWNAHRSPPYFGYGSHKNFFLCRPRGSWYPTRMLIAAPGRTKRARIAIQVVLRLTAMDVCCGPPSCH